VVAAVSIHIRLRNGLPRRAALTVDLLRLGQRRGPSGKGLPQF
jgi:hypothetical protein